MSELSPGVLAIAGLDPSGGSGLLADAEAIRANGGRPLCVPTALTVQTTRAARRFEPVAHALVAEMAHALLEEENVRAVKIGMIAEAKTARAVRELLQKRPDLPVVVDPVLQSSSGLLLFKGKLKDAADAYFLLAHNGLLTPNQDEASVLGGLQTILGKGPRAVLLKGGHAEGDTVTDTLTDKSGSESFASPRIQKSKRGTGCRLASAIAAGLAQGLSQRDAVIKAREYVREYLSG